jgi:hypothetical protein
MRTRRATTIALVCSMGACGTSVDGAPADASADMDAANATTPIWTLRCGGDDDRAISIDANHTGEIFVAASTRSSRFDFGDASVACAPPCIALGAFDADGGSVWSLAFAAGGTAALRAMAADVAGGVILAGDLFAPTDLTGPPLDAPACTSAALPDVFLSRFDDSGYFLWQRRFGDCDAQTASAIAVDGTAILVGGAFQSKIDFGAGPIAAVGARDLFVARFDAGGEVQWARDLVVSNADASAELRAISADGTGGVFVAGSAVDAIDLGGGPLTPRGDRDIFVGKYGETGAHVWSRRFGDAGTHDVASVAAIASEGAGGAGGVVIAGVAHGSIDFGGGALGGDGVYVAGLAADGTHRWSRLFVSTSASVARVRAGASGTVIVAGTFQGEIGFGGDVLSSGDASPSSSAAFVVALDASGAHLVSRAFVGAPGTVGASDLAVDGRGDTLLFGSFAGTLSSDLDALTDRGGGDLFVAKLARR